VDIRGRDLRSAVRDMQQAVGEKVKLAARLFEFRGPASSNFSNAPRPG
jgi:Cu/Ag efflux pump CusA